jgi:hypothetical protein
LSLESECCCLQKGYGKFLLWLPPYTRANYLIANFKSQHVCTHRVLQFWVHIVILNKLVAKISILFGVGTVTSRKWIWTPGKLHKNRVPTFCCPLSEPSYVPLKNNKISLLKREISILDKYVDFWHVYLPDPDILCCISFKRADCCRQFELMLNTFGAFMAEICPNV